jgi:peptidoglycan/xylan/chitin deacetylase (PgdA/CDA1 family)
LRANPWTGGDYGPSQLPWLRVARAARARRSAILAYHGVERVEAARDPEGLCIDPDLFREQIGFLVDAGFEFVTVRDFVARTRAPAAETGLIAITFDDGLANLKTIALPLMRDLGVTATIYVTTGLIGEAYPWASADSGLRIMDADAIRDVAAAGIEIGAHTVSHPDLSLCSYEENLREMVESRQALERLLDAPVSTFAYPFARFSADSERAARDAGFDAAVSYSTLTSGESVFSLSRELVTGQHGIPSIALKAAGRYDRLFFSAPGRAVRWAGRAISRS